MFKWSMDIKRFTTYIFIYFLEGVVCGQNGTKIVLEFSCPEYGSSGICEGKITGECGCAILPTDVPTATTRPTTTIPGQCVDGNQVCVSECECTKGYYECENGVWVEKPIPSINIFYFSICCMCSKWNFN